MRNCLGFSLEFPLAFLICSTTFLSTSTCCIPDAVLSAIAIVLMLSGTNPSKFMSQTLAILPKGLLGSSTSSCCECTIVYGIFNLCSLKKPPSSLINGPSRAICSINICDSKVSVVSKFEFMSFIKGPNLRDALIA